MPRVHIQEAVCSIKAQRLGERQALNTPSYLYESELLNIGILLTLFIEGDEPPF